MRLGRGESVADQQLIDEMLADVPSRRRPLFGPGGGDRHEQAVSHHRGREPIRSADGETTDAEPLDHRDAMPHVTPPRLPPRRGRLRWPCPGWNRCRCAPTSRASWRRRMRRSKPPVRFACIYFSNGVEPMHWWAKGSGAAMEIGPGLAADAALPRGHRLPARAVQRAGRGSTRVRTWAAFPTCSPARGSAPTRTKSASARRWTRSWPSRSASSTAVPSLVLGIEPTELRLEDGLSMIYGSCISWASRHQAGDQGDLSRAGLRPARRRRQGPRGSTAASSTR